MSLAMLTILNNSAINWLKKFSECLDEEIAK